MRPGLVAGGGLGSILLVIFVVLLGGDPGAVVTEPQLDAERVPDHVGAQDSLREFTEVVLKDTEDVWGSLFLSGGGNYPEPRLRLFSGAVQSGCGYAGAAVGPFYCAADRRVYIDLEFYEQLRRGLGAPGDFAQAYVIAHEVGHHVQTVTGSSQRVAEASQGGRSARANELSVRQELQADCFAGVWAHHTRIPLDPGDLEEGLRAAGAIGDDRLQRQAQGEVRPESFTHGSSEQRIRWLRRGMETGDPGACDTFSTNAL